MKFFNHFRCNIPKKFQHQIENLESDTFYKKFDNVVRFMPEIPEPPHTQKQHEEMDSWNDKLQELMKRETNGRNINN